MDLLGFVGVCRGLQKLLCTHFLSFFLQRVKVLFNKKVFPNPNKPQQTPTNLNILIFR